MKSLEDRGARSLIRGPTIRPISVLNLLAQGADWSEVHSRWPTLTEAALAKLLKRAANALVNQAPTASRLGKHLDANPRVCHGQWVFAGTRVPARTVLTILGRAASLDEILEDWPELTRPAVQDVIRRAARALAREEIARARPGRST